MLCYACVWQHSIEDRAKLNIEQREIKKKNALLCYYKKDKLKKAQWKEIM